MQNRVGHPPRQGFLMFAATHVEGAGAAIGSGRAESDRRPPHGPSTSRSAPMRDFEKALAAHEAPSERRYGVKVRAMNAATGE